MSLYRALEDDEEPVRPIAIVVDELALLVDTQLQGWNQLLEIGRADAGKERQLREEVNPLVIHVGPPSD
ncbi:MAG TPA: hypothetical protein VJB57_15470 [Dehalococcoidia bacterium]|nr:hypothetical protein [Dehalococcoidia bacterium]